MTIRRVRKEYRVTRHDPFTAGTPGAAPAGRNGHYVIAWSMEEAVCLVADQFPDERRFHVQAWNGGRVDSSNCDAHTDPGHSNDHAHLFEVVREAFGESTRIARLRWLGAGPAHEEWDDAAAENLRWMHVLFGDQEGD